MPRTIKYRRVDAHGNPEPPMFEVVGALMYDPETDDLDELHDLSCLCDDCIDDAIAARLERCDEVA